MKGRKTCRSCRNAMSRAWNKKNRKSRTESNKKWRHENPEKNRECWRSSYLLRSYGITEAAYQDMLAGQGGHCLLCDATDDLVVDHNHETEEVRGILCRACNSGLGHLGDNPERVLAAYHYLIERGYYG